MTASSNELPIGVVDSAGTTAAAVREAVQGAAGINANDQPCRLQLMATDPGTAHCAIMVD